MRMRAGLLMLLLLLLLLVWRHPWCRAQASSFLRRRLGRFSLQIDQAQAAAHLRDVDEIFGRCGMDFWLTEGTALGAVRDGRVIPTDTDIDVGVRDGRALRACALPRLRRRGFMVWRDKPHIVSVVRGFLRLDVMVLAPGGHCVDMPCDEMERFVANLRRVDLYGRTFWTLGEDYLRRVYGADWRTFRYQWKPPETAAP